MTGDDDAKSHQIGGRAKLLRFLGQCGPVGVNPAGQPAGLQSGVWYAMRRIIDASEVLGTVKSTKGESEVCVAAEAAYDEAENRLVVNLITYLRPRDLLTKEEHFRLEWMPKNETVTEVVGLEESHDLARELFQRWVHKVRTAAPFLHPA